LYKIKEQRENWIKEPGSSKDTKVDINISHNLFNNPITKDHLEGLELFQDFKAGNQGTNFSATKEQYLEILSMVQKTDSNAKNVILYGPPGTGKTFKTIDHALARIENRSLDSYSSEKREDIVRRFLHYRDNGQVEFVTFHQSFGYEDFVEGIKPVLESEGETESKEISYEISDGVFKKICQAAKQIQQKSGYSGKIDFENVTFYKMSVGGKEDPDMHQWCIDNNYVALGWGGENDFSEFTGISKWKEFRDRFKKELPEIAKEWRFTIQAQFAFQHMKIGDVVLISKGNRIVDAIGVIQGDYEYRDDPETAYFHFRKVEWIATDLNAPAQTYVKKNISQQSIYQFYTSDIRIENIEKLIDTSENRQLNYVLIIDEINRGNISKIFGELITLVESSKRIGAPDEISVTLPYSKENFAVPPNLYIIGTMNTADRSIALMDTALRRRFDFVEMMPDTNIDELDRRVDGIHLKSLLDQMNERIEFLYDRDHMIGHSYFINVDSHHDLCDVFKNRVIPLLQEYFYEDWAKIQLVLGDNKEWKKDDTHRLVRLKKHYSGENEKELFGLDLEDYEDVSVYEVNPALTMEQYDEIPKEAFLYIYESPAGSGDVD